MDTLIDTSKCVGIQKSVNFIWLWAYLDIKAHVTQGASYVLDPRVPY